MPLKVVVSEDQTGVVLYGHGRLCLEDLTAANATVDSLVERGADFAWSLGDHSDVTKFDFKVADMLDVSRLSRKIARTRRSMVLVVITPSDLMYGLARIWQSLSRDQAVRIGVFRRRRQAESYVVEMVLKQRGIRVALPSVDDILRADPVV